MNYHDATKSNREEFCFSCHFGSFWPIFPHVRPFCQEERGVVFGCVDRLGWPGQTRRFAPTVEPPARRPQGPPLRRLPVGQGRHAGLPLRLAAPGRAATRATPTKGLSGPGQTHRCAPAGWPPRARRPQGPPLRRLPVGQGRHTGLPLRWGFCHRSGPMTWRTSGPRGGTGRVWILAGAVPALAGGRI